uniref:Uncharacterized protein n=1 Tax=Rosa rugosa TaxID=74645 RepID=J7G594_ROSRU|nr:hypothetical protein [Rosa rugosa]
MLDRDNDRVWSRVAHIKIKKSERREKKKRGIEDRGILRRVWKVKKRRGREKKDKQNRGKEKISARIDRLQGISENWSRRLKKGEEENQDQDHTISSKSVIKINYGEQRVLISVLLSLKVGMVLDIIDIRWRKGSVYLRVREISIKCSYQAVRYRRRSVASTVRSHCPSNAYFAGGLRGHKCDHGHLSSFFFLSFSVNMKREKAECFWVPPNNQETKKRMKSSNIIVQRAKSLRNKFCLLGAFSWIRTMIWL